MVKKAAQATPNELLRRARLERGWTQKDVADRIGSPLNVNINRWERGTAIPSAFYAQRLSEVFGKSLTELGLLPPQQSEVASPGTGSAPALEGVSASSEPPSFWNVPFRRNLFFTGRGQILSMLHEHFSQNRGAALVQSQALSGLGGIGKTQTAVEYAYRYRAEYRAVFWVRAASHETLVTDFVALARLLELPERNAQDQAKVVAAVEDWFTRHHGWLLILDNVDELSLVSEFLPTRGQGHVLMTTRAQATGKLAESLPVDKLDMSEGILLLLRRAKLLSPDAPLDMISSTLSSQAQAIVREMDGLPLALEQAGAYIEETGCSLSEYLALYKQRKLALLKRESAFSQEYPYTVASTWALAFQQIEQENPQAAELLRLCAFLDPDAIPEEILVSGVAALGPMLVQLAADPFLLNEAIQALRRYSLM
ncbi:MAG TPA: helix-turn-helix domain-containing protein, partial [Ktedonobacteraceae bacterium]